MWFGVLPYNLRIILHFCVNIAWINTLGRKSVFQVFEFMAFISPRNGIELISDPNYYTVGMRFFEVFN